MSDEVAVEALEKAKSAHERITELDDKKLSKHEFNGYKHVVTGIMKQGQKNEDAQKENTVAINGLSDAFHEFKEHLFMLVTKEIIPAIVKTILAVGIGFLAVIGFFGSKILGWW